MRPVGHQVNEVVLDNDSAGGDIHRDMVKQQQHKVLRRRLRSECRRRSLRYAGTVTGAATATATYTPNIPQAGFYPVYTWVLYGTDRTANLHDQSHRRQHRSDGRSQHRRLGLGLPGDLPLQPGQRRRPKARSSSQTKPPLPDKVVIADAIRFGNGMGDYIFTGSGATAISGYPREDENSYHWLARSVGQGTTVASVIGTASSANVSAPSDYAEYMFHGAFGGAVYIGFHSNAGGGRGARGLIDTDVADRTPHQAGTNGLADILGKQINQDMQSLNGVFEYNWTTGTTSTYTGQFGEINLGRER